MKRFLLVLVLSLFVTSTVWGFNGVRKGFILGGGIGLGMTSFKEELGSLSTDWSSNFAFMTDFKIGYAPNEQWEIYYSDKSSWFDYYGITALHSFGTAAISYYLTPATPTFFLSGGLGFSAISAPFESNSGSDIGFGTFVGGGYEFAKHFAVQFDLMFGMPQESGYTFTGVTPRVTVVATAF
ncbi:MAG TPA: hypothetical protein VJ165_02905 [candidate division Zixibacteria bacterium]|nr:hypothetical protein [candidate division Zixibacteria bacterium]